MKSILTLLLTIGITLMLNAQWVQTTEVNGNSINCLVVKNNTIFVGSEAGGVFLSTDYGTNWSQVNNGLTNLNIISLAVKDSNIFAGTLGDGVFLTSNNGLSWSQAGLPNLNVKPLIVSGSNIFAAADSGYFPSGISLGVFLSTNNGTDWSQVNNGLTNLNIYCFMVSNNNIFCSGQDGVFLTNNNGSNWLSVNEGLPDTETPSTLVICETYIFTGTREGHVWRRLLSEMITNIEEVEQIPNNFELEQNYPNPFNPSTTIKYQLAQDGRVSLKIYDILGNEVSTLVNENQKQGNYEVQFDASKLSSGVYFYKLQAGDFVSFKKMILLK